MADAYRNEASAVEVNSFIRNVYGWMAAALALTGFVALGMTRVPGLQQAIVGNQFIFILLILGELGLVVYLAARIQKMSVGAATGAFIAYSILNGITLSVIFLAYTEATIARAFFVTAGVFAVMTVYGFVTKTDLTKLGNIFGMALIGFIIASLVNFFLRSETLYWIITYAGVVIFTGLVAYDAQWIKRFAQTGGAEGETGQKMAVFGALKLYLDFINLFLLLLRILGRRR